MIASRAPGAPPVGDPGGALPPLTLVLGGARSGKSRWAEALVECRGDGLYLATAEAGDAEMDARIAAHRARRGAHWRTLEEPLDLAESLTRNAEAGRPILVDCLTLWLSNLMAHADATNDPDMVAGTIETTIERLVDLPGPVVMVSNEVGLGIVPDNATARAFRDHAGRLHQGIAQRAGWVIFVTAGLPTILKGPRRSPS